mgnify:FL=1
MFSPIFKYRQMILIILTATGLQACSTLTTSTLSPDIMTDADQYYQNGQLAQAEHLYREVVATAPRVSVAWFQLGNIYVRTNQLDAAVNAFQQATQVAPNEARYWVNLSLTRHKQAQQAAFLGLRYLPNDKRLQLLAHSDTGAQLVEQLP